MTNPYDPHQIEAKWQAIWEAEGINGLTDEQLRNLPRKGKPFYNLMMFPYPSAEGLHIGNIYAFTGADVYGRFKRLQGYDVFEPIGFDAFGIHSENFALKMGTHPSVLIPRNIERFSRQLRSAGLMLDWDHVVDTTSPEYYRWTQWLFLQLYKSGLAEKKDAPVNWCPSCNTVLANEQVVAGECERCGTPVQTRVLSQWFFRITEYAPRLLDNLKRIDWSDKTRKAQEAWIGRSRGARIGFPVVGHGETEIQAYTTRADTLFGATYVVLAPEHSLVERITAPARLPEVLRYRADVMAADLVTRKKTDKVKTGVDTGARVLNPINGLELPVWVADYVLMEYGTGAVMGVPGHDTRDREFAVAFDLPIVEVIRLADDATGEGDDASDVLVNSGDFNGLSPADARTAIVARLAERGQGEETTSYRLHDWCISRQRYWGPPIPMLYCESCGTVPVPEDQLPIVLPNISDYRPDASGVSPLARHEEWYLTTCPTCGGTARRDTDVSDTFLDSAWYFLRYPSANYADVAFDPALTRDWLPVDSCIGGNEHAVLHLLYVRFVTMVLHDLGHLDFEEPFRRFRAHGMIIKEGAKMSKSRGNVVIPDEFIARWGADTFRLYLMFFAPYLEGGDFRDAGISGPSNFLHRLWDAAAAAEERPIEPEVERKLHATIRKVTEDIEVLSYNTAVAAMMEFMNVLRARGRVPERAAIEPLVQLLSPFAPHIAEELWQRLGHDTSLFAAPSWPTFDPGKIERDTVELVLQVNGKVRSRITSPRGLGEEAAAAAALADEAVLRAIAGKIVRKTVFVPDRLINVVAA